ncbi:MAG: NAD-dependent epimerase/dehydratase family protein [Bradyrhizobium sp.]
MLCLAPRCSTRACGCRLASRCQPPCSRFGDGHWSRCAVARRSVEGRRRDRRPRRVPDATLVRPALVYGPGDHFFTRFAPLARRAPAIPLIGGGRTRFQPMHVDDVTEAMVRILEEPRTAGRTFELGASEIFTFRELIERLCRAVGHQPRLVSIPLPFAEAGAYLTQWLPHAPLTFDQVRLLNTDKVIRDSNSGPVAVGVQPRPLDTFLAQLASGFAARSI